MTRRSPAVVLSAVFIAAACGGGGGGTTTGPTAGVTTAAPTAGGTSSSPSATASAGDPNDLLAKVREAGKLVISTDANYKPQSFLNPDGTFEGFDIDVGREIAERLGVEAEFTAQMFEVVEAGSWNERWDVSVGSITITKERKDIFDFTQAYYYTPAQMAATEASGITTLDGLAGKKICVGASTTYQFWLEGTLVLEDAPEPATPPEGAEPFPLETDQLCAQTAKSGRTDFEGFLTSSTTLDAAIADGSPLVPVGDPVFYESLAVAFDKNGPPRAEILAEVDRIIGEMHEDGTLTELSEQWFDGVDLTKANE